MNGHPSFVRWFRVAAGAAPAVAFALATALAAQAQEKPNIDRIAKEGVTGSA